MRLPHRALPLGRPAVWIERGLDGDAEQGAEGNRGFTISIMDLGACLQQRRADQRRAVSAPPALLRRQLVVVIGQGPVLKIDPPGTATFLVNGQENLEAREGVRTASGRQRIETPLCAFGGVAIGGQQHGALVGEVVRDNRGAVARCRSHLPDGCRVETTRGNQIGGDAGDRFALVIMIDGCWHRASLTHRLSWGQGT